MDDDIETYESADAGASKTTPIQAGAIKKSNIVLLKGHPCKVVEISTSKTGKHGHAKVSLTGLDVFTSKKYEDMCPSTHNMEQVVTKRKEYQCLDVNDEGFLTLMDDEGETREDLKMPFEEVSPDAFKKVSKAMKEKESIQVIVMSAMGQEAIIEAKE